MLTAIWKVILRPILIVLLGSSGIKAIEDHPILGFLFCILSATISIFTIIDLCHRLGADMPWLTHAVTGVMVFVLTAAHYVLAWGAAVTAAALHITSHNSGK
jgi:hypothetical protein